MSQNAGVEQTNSQGQQQNNGAGDTGQVQAPETQQTQQQQTQTPYDPYLQRLPESVRPVVEPIFREWDAGVTQRFQQLHSQFGWAEPWQEIAQQYDPDTVSQSVQLLQALSDDPEAFYRTLGETYGFSAEQIQQIAEQGQPGANGNQQVLDPRLDQIEQTLGSLAESILSEREQNQQAQEEQELIQHLEQLKAQHGDFDLDYVVTKIATGMAPQDAVLAYRALVGQQAQQLIAPGQQAPVVMPGSGGGGVPSTSVDFRKLDRNQTQGLVASLLEANKQQS